MITFLKKQTKPAKLPFTDMAFIAIVIPLFIDRLLQMVVGVTDTFVISYTGEASVSGVSLVDQFNNIFIFISTALAAGGAVITSQYIGSGNTEKAKESAGQLLTISAVLGIVMSLFVAVFHKALLGLLFGSVEPVVMDAAIVYIRITLLSLPMITVYDAGAALYRSMGRTRTTMYVSLFYNVLNVIGNVIGVFILKAGVAGVAWPTVLSRAAGALIITILCLNKANEVHYEWSKILKFNADIQKRILRVAVPNGFENGVFQFVKVALTSIVSLFGTSQIAAYGISQTFWSLSNSLGNAGGPAFMTVIGQCMGDENTDAAEYYFHRFDKILVLIGTVWNLIIVLSLPVILRFYAVSEETRHMVFLLVLLHNIFCAILSPYWGSSASGLRAAGDIRFTVVVAIASTVIVRLGISGLFGIILGMGAYGVAWSMVLDWAVRSVIIIGRIKSGRWKTNRLI